MSLFVMWGALAGACLAAVTVPLALYAFACAAMFDGGWS